MSTGIPQRDLAPAEERILIDREIPEEFERDMTGLSDIVRNPFEKPLATLAALLVTATLGYQVVVAATQYHPLVGVLAAVVGGVAYLIAKKIWAVQHRFILREMAKEGELEKLRARTDG